MDRAGIEPATHGFSVPESASDEGPSNCNQQAGYANQPEMATGGAQQKAQHFCGESDSNSELSLIVQRWPTLRPEIKAGILAMIRVEAAQ